MLHQMHQHHIDGTTEFIAQDEPTAGLNSRELSREFQKWARGVKDRYPLPDGSVWWCHNEKSPKFVLAAGKPEEAVTTN